jgi:hypothetical protein
MPHALTLTEGALALELGQWHWWLNVAITMHYMEPNSLSKLALNDRYIAIHSDVCADVTAQLVCANDVLVTR